jgi:6-phosphofructokinase 2
MGSAGAIVATRRGVLRLAVEARSTVGAGDSFLGAFILRLSRRRAMDEALSFAIAAGAAAVLHPGTKLCKLGDVLRLHGAAHQQAAE